MNFLLNQQVKTNLSRNVECYFIKSFDLKLQVTKYLIILWTHSHLWVGVFVDGWVDG